jgi:hypothetical protein
MTSDGPLRVVGRIVPKDTKVARRSIHR